MFSQIYKINRLHGNFDGNVCGNMGNEHQEQ